MEIYNPVKQVSLIYIELVSLEMADEPGLTGGNHQPLANTGKLSNLGSAPSGTGT